MTFRGQIAKRRLSLTLYLIAICVAVILFYLWIVPEGLSLSRFGIYFLPFMHRQQTIASPANKHVLRAVIGDGGALHSGAHWTLILDESSWLRKHVVAEGYIADPNTIPANWISDDEVEISFLKANQPWSDSFRVVHLKFD